MKRSKRNMLCILLAAGIMAAGIPVGFVQAEEVSANMPALSLGAADGNNESSPQKQAADQGAAAENAVFPTGENTVPSTGEMSAADAIPYNMGGTEYGWITEDKKVETYQFSIPSSGRIDLSFEGKMEGISYYLYDADGEIVFYERGHDWNQDLQTNAINIYSDLVKGTYYLAFNQSSGYGAYSFRISYTSAKESFPESMDRNNNSAQTADKIALGQMYIGQIADNDDNDTYKFTLPSSGRLNLSFSGSIGRLGFYLYDSDGERIWYDSWHEWNGTTKDNALNLELDLTSGDYFFSIRYGHGTGNYKLKTTFASANESFKETGWGNNNSTLTANTISVGKQYAGQIAENDTVDNYKFVFPASGNLKLNFNGSVPGIHLYIYNTKGEEVWRNNYHYWNETIKQNIVNEQVTLTAGTYYFSVAKYIGTGNYKFGLNYSVYSSRPQIKASSAGYDKIKIFWNRTSEASGYEIYRSTSKNGKYSKIKTISNRNTASYTNKGLKCGTTYYYKIRSFKTVAGKKYYSNFSARVSCKLKLQKAVISKVRKAGTGKIQVIWKKVSGASGYEVYRSTKIRGKYTKVKTVSSGKSIQFKDSRLKKNKKYYYKVRAYRLVNGKKVYGGWSAIKSLQLK